ncbi:MAG: TfoX/Sxy family protein [Nitrosopumilaceae archaeon]
MTYNETLAKKIRESIKGKRNITEKKMFGGVGFMFKGNMACGVNKEDLIIRVGPDAYEQAVIQPHVRPFDFTGRPMKGYILVEPEAIDDRALAQ